MWVDAAGFVQSSSTNKFQTFITQELESQDQLRRFMEREKNLNMDIKKLQQERNSEFKEYQKEIQDNQSKIQEQKETLMSKTQRAEIEVNYSQKEHTAELSNQRRMNEYTQKLLANELANLRSKIRTETEVHKELKDYLVKKEEEIRRKAEEWNTKFETTKEQLDREIARLTELKEKTDSELSEYKEKYEMEEKRKMEREMEEKNKAQEKQNKVIIHLSLGVPANPGRERHPTHPERVPRLEGGRRRQEEKEEEVMSSTQTFSASVSAAPHRSPWFKIRLRMYLFSSAFLTYRSRFRTGLCPLLTALAKSSFPRLSVAFPNCSRIASSL